MALDTGFKDKVDTAEKLAEAITLEMASKADALGNTNPVVAYPVYGEEVGQDELARLVSDDVSSVAYVLNTTVLPRVGLQRDTAGIISEGNFLLFVVARGQGGRLAVQTADDILRAVGFETECETTGINPAVPYFKGNMQFWYLGPVGQQPLTAIKWGSDYFAVQIFMEFKGGE